LRPLCFLQDGALLPFPCGSLIKSKFAEIHLEDFALLVADKIREIFMSLWRYLIVFIRIFTSAVLVGLFIWYGLVVDEIHKQWVIEKSSHYPYVFSQKGNGFLYMTSDQNDTRLMIFGAGAVVFLIGAVAWNIPLKRRQKP
ncbi:hypothetical protein, partial [Asticcacaulis sp. AC402]|uniref:hypothetical protein n=1 Tax=Asticcacaulis sp. AC402 TaxID=1282361 RepID=UPI0004CE119D